MNLRMLLMFHLPAAFHKVAGGSLAAVEIRIKEEQTWGLFNFTAGALAASSAWLYRLARASSPDMLDSLARMRLAFSRCFTTAQVLAPMVAPVD
jgi:hypothetical protein